MSREGGAPFPPPPRLEPEDDPAPYCAAALPVPGPAGIYVHIPFCRKKCRYCDFFSSTDLTAVPVVIDAMISEIRHSFRPADSADSLYFGGGTPSLLSAGDIARIIDAVAGRFSIRPFAEITIEVNPNSLDTEQASGLVRAGVNRVNIGVQSFRDDHLSFLGRLHTARDAENALALSVKAGFSSIGMDLIYGLPGQTEASWVAELEKAVSLAPDHISCYLLSVEPGTPLHADAVGGRVSSADEGTAAGLFDITHHFLETNGYPAYEISNFSPDRNRRSRHNLKYWNFSPYIGIGPAAHSCSYPKRWWNHAELTGYLDAVDRGRRPIEGCECLSTTQQIMEAVMLRLRTTDGMDIPWFNERFGLDFRQVFSEAAPPHVRSGKMVLTDRFCRLTRKGFRFHEGICRDLFECL